jgi:hypothetical protein
MKNKKKIKVIIILKKKVKYIYFKKYIFNSNKLLK